LELTGLYRKGKEALLAKDIGVFLGVVETEFVMANNRKAVE